MIRRIVGGAFAVVVASGGLIGAGVGPLGTAAAHAATPSCSATASVGISPGLTLSSKKQTETVSGTLTSCTGGTTTSGTLKGSLSGSQSCTAGTAKGTATITWNNKKTSTVSASLVLSDGSGTLSAKVTKGVYKGDHVAVTGSESHNGNCITSPVTSVTLTGTVTF